MIGYIFLDRGDMKKKIMLFFQIKCCLTWVALGMVFLYTLKHPSLVHGMFCTLVLIYAMIQEAILRMFEEEFKEGE